MARALAALAARRAKRKAKEAPVRPVGAPERAAGDAAREDGARRGDRGVPASQASPRLAPPAGDGKGAPARALSQRYLSLGQKTFAGAACPDCGLWFVRGVAADEALHRTVHADWKRKARGRERDEEGAEEGGRRELKQVRLSFGSGTAKG